MLVLSRRTGESIFIGDNVEVTIVAVHGSRVKVGINCPREIPVFRSEILERDEPLGSRETLPIRPAG